MTILYTVVTLMVVAPLLALAILLVSIAGISRDYQENDDSLLDRYLDSQAPEKQEPKDVDG